MRCRMKSVTRGCNERERESAVDHVIAGGEEAY